jgi:hypothetical protein
MMELTWTKEECEEAETHQDDAHLVSLMDDE